MRADRHTDIICMQDVASHLLVGVLTTLLRVLDD